MGYEWINKTNVKKEIIEVLNKNFKQMFTTGFDFKKLFLLMCIERVSRGKKMYILLGKIRKETVQYRVSYV